ncbi:MAG TPA: FeoB small GTPase domain-containing protein [Candidatus Methanoculleus thermohydrogenotrophicum]|jgi:ferrous iron transport protein B|nr:FeoB small GTPase domain-containing protein [Candidatus Methanoculleus thermohydrogenotrophicum]NLM82519.1 GTP-binding protein [Candidatus Methanoculleus thermohydrogenotrophicum]HOB17427.1 FeoB small GTPase domain-containing protein [Candidatus Methanoculleus thermohydrogenotrophicum]HPZ37585.1 FeoB small GTPase domain-containing protein [Candidatus Methanoculleus thermohydrogenotrophicum]HQC90675.1 FeoB small GTPase domain-containing protein [Candidatus Methanoculleus thermohydrogenotrophi
MAKSYKTVLMMGNPNVGKSALFNRLTGGDAVVSNYPGTTVDYTEGVLIVSGQEYEVIDAPGTYSLEARDAAEGVAVRLLAENPDAAVLIVLDATRVERGLYLVLEVIERGYPVIIALNMIDAARERQIAVDFRMLQKILGAPVVPTSAVSGEGVRDLAEMIRKAQRVDIAKVRARADGQFDEPETGCGLCGGC